MFQSGYDDEKYISEIESLIQEIRFTSSKDNETLRNWFRELKSSVNFLELHLYQGLEDNNTMSPAITFPDLPEKYQSSIQLLKEIKVALSQKDETSARKKLMRLTGRMVGMKLVVAISAIVFFLFAFGLIFFLDLKNFTPKESSQEPIDELERIRQQFKQN